MTHGVGWFLSNDGNHVLAYRKMSNGYEDRPYTHYPVVFIKDLANKL